MWSIVPLIALLIGPFPKLAPPPTPVAPPPPKLGRKMLRSGPLPPPVLLEVPALVMFSALTTGSSPPLIRAAAGPTGCAQRGRGSHQGHQALSVEYDLRDLDSGPVEAVDTALDHPDHRSRKLARSRRHQDRRIRESGLDHRRPRCRPTRPIALPPNRRSRRGRRSGRRHRRYRHRRRSQAEGEGVAAEAAEATDHTAVARISALAADGQNGVRKEREARTERARVSAGTAKATDQAAESTVATLAAGLNRGAAGSIMLPRSRPPNRPPSGSSAGAFGSGASSPPRRPRQRHRSEDALYRRGRQRHRSVRFRRRRRLRRCRC